MINNVFNRSTNDPMYHRLSNIDKSFSEAILTTRNTQFGQELALVMQTTHAQRWQYPGCVD